MCVYCLGEMGEEGKEGLRMDERERLVLGVTGE